MPVDNDLCYASGSDLLRRYGTREVSPVEVLDAQLARVDEVNDRLNCITHRYLDQAFEAAREAERRYANGTARPLEGLTVGVKDEHGLEGWTVTQGSRTCATETLSESEPIAERLAEAGAVMPFQTTVPEFYLAAVTWSELWGVTRNPWNLRYAVGGSSGGSGAALAAGMCTLATGSDMGGSIRIPCAFNGLYGFKPPYGRVPSTTDPFLHIASAGPLARTLTDVARMENVISGPHPYAPTAIAPKLELPLDPPSIESVRIAYSPDQSWAVIDPEVRTNTEAALDILRAAGAEVSEVDLGLEITDADMSQAFAEAALFGPMGAQLASIDERDELTTYARYFCEKAESGFGPADALAFENNMLEGNRRIHDRVYAEGFDALVMPTLTTSHIPADHDYTTDRTVVDGTEVSSLSGWILTPLFNLLYTMPVIAAPTGLTSQNVPTSMQIVGRPYDDLMPFRVAAAYERLAPPMFIDDRLPDFRSE